MFPVCRWRFGTRSRGRSLTSTSALTSMSAFLFSTVEKRKFRIARDSPVVTHIQICLSRYSNVSKKLRDTTMARHPLLDVTEPLVIMWPTVWEGTWRRTDAPSANSDLKGREEGVRSAGRVCFPCIPTKERIKVSIGSICVRRVGSARANARERVAIHRTAGQSPSSLVVPSRDKLLPACHRVNHHSA